MLTRADHLPNFFVIGSPKCGTTSLHDLLRAHPATYMPSIKEPAFFSHPPEYRRGLAYYSKTYFGAVSHHQAIGEATPWYLHVEGCAERIRDDLPAGSHRFVVILRNPTTRAYSQYWDQRNTGRENRTFDAAIGEEMDAPGWPASQPECLRAYARIGRYERYIQHYIEVFGRERILVLFQDDMHDQDKVRGLLRDLAAFLCIDPFPSNVRPPNSNVAKAPRSMRFERWLNASPAGRPLGRAMLGKLVPRPLGRHVASRLASANKTSRGREPMSDPTRQALTEYYIPTYQYIENLTGRSTEHWHAAPLPSSPR